MHPIVWNIALWIPQPGVEEGGLIYACSHLSGKLMGKKTKNCAAVKKKILPFITGDCTFEKPLAACGYSQGRDDDLDWEQASTREKPSSDPWVPSGKADDTRLWSLMKMLLINLPQTAITMRLYRIVGVGVPEGLTGASVWDINMNGSVTMMQN